jgi:hypothetical protein
MILPTSFSGTLGSSVSATRKLTFCIIRTRKQAEDILHRLESERFSDDRVSVVFPKKGAFDLPGLGPFVASGPIVAELTSAGADAGPGGLASGLAGLGVPEFEARLCQEKIEEGNFLFSVHAATTEEVNVAKGIFADMGAQIICSPEESAAADPRAIPAQPHSGPNFFRFRSSPSFSHPLIP